MSILRTVSFLLRHPLARRRPGRALSRYARWQLGSRLLPGPVVHSWVNGARFLVRPGDTGLTGNVYAGLHEFEDMAFLLHVVRKGDLFIDVGANVGSYTLLACAAVGADGVAFEPIPATFARLVENVRLNNMEARVRCVNKAIGDYAGSVQFTSTGDTRNHALAANELTAAAITVPVDTLDAELTGTKPVLMKIDVEGYETLVLRGAEASLTQDSLLAVILELGNGARYGFDENDIFAFMNARGFAPFTYDAFQRRLLPLHGSNPNGGNTLFVRNRDEVTRRTNSAPAVTVFDEAI